MADYVARIAPFINVTFYVTSVWWEQPRNHRGLDIATPSSLGNVPLYSMCNGTVVHKDYDANGYRQLLNNERCYFRNGVFICTFTSTFK